MYHPPIAIIHMGPFYQIIIQEGNMSATRPEYLCYPRVSQEVDRW